MSAPEFFSHPDGESDDLRDPRLNALGSEAWTLQAGVPTTSGGQRSSGTGWEPPSVEHLQLLLPNYEILGLLGRGGMGAVYKARQISLDRLVAIKILPSDIHDEEVNYGERFKNEARTMARLSHPAIVSLIEFGETSEQLLYMVLEFIEGTDVAQMLEERPILPPEEALRIAAHMCDALGYAHSHHVIHRDIKPANVMLDKEGRVKVADFGLAKMATGDSGLTQTNMVMGTPDYIAPETYLGMHLADHRADIFAVGVMLYRMITGSVPRGSYLKPSHKVRGLDPRLDGIIEKAMEEEREARYQSAAELRAAIDEVLSRPATTLQAPSQMLRQPASRPTPSVGGMPRSPQPPHVYEEGEEKVSRGVPWGTLFLVLLAGASVFFLWQMRQKRSAATTESTVTANAPSQTTPGAGAVPHAGSPSGMPSPLNALPPAAGAEVHTVAMTSPSASVPPQPLPPMDPGVFRVSVPEGTVLIEGESLSETSVATGGKVDDTRMRNSRGDAWSGGRELHWGGFVLGNTLTIPFEVAKAGNYEIQTRMTRGPYQANVMVKLDGGPASYGLLLLDSNNLELSPPLPLGTHTLKEGSHKLEITPVRAAGRDMGIYIFGMDYLTLKPVERAATVYPRVMTITPSVEMNNPVSATPPAPLNTRIEVERYLMSLKGGTYSTGSASRFSGGLVVAWRPSEKGNELGWTLPVAVTGQYRVILGLEHSPIAVVASAKVNGRASEAKDFYALGGGLPVRWDLGVHELKADALTLDVVMEGANSGAGQPYVMLMDYVELEPVYAGAGGRTWTDASGRTITADFRGLSEGQVSLEVETARGKQVSRVPLEKLSADSQKKARDLAAAGAGTDENLKPISHIVVEGEINAGTLLLNSQGLSLRITAGNKPSTLLVNGSTWPLLWNGDTSLPCNILERPLKPVNSSTFIEMARLSGSGIVYVVDTPGEENGQTLSVGISDENSSNVSMHRIRLRW